MAKKKGVRRIITFECTETGQRTYTSQKNTRNTPDRLELKKYNPKAKKHTVYKEIK